MLLSYLELVPIVTIVLFCLPKVVHALSHSTWESCIDIPTVYKIKVILVEATYSLYMLPVLFEMNFYTRLASLAVGVNKWGRKYRKLASNNS